MAALASRNPMDHSRSTEVGPAKTISSFFEETDMNRKQKTSLTLALGAAFLAGLVAMPAAAADNPFAVRASADGYQVAATEAKCGEGKCGAAMGMGDTKKAEPGKTSADKATEKAKAKTKAKAKATEAKMKCGEGKCGAAMGMTEQDKAKMQKSEEGKCGGSKK